MAKTWVSYLMFIGAYVAIFLFLQIIPVEIDFVLAMLAGVIGMILAFLYTVRQKDLDFGNLYKTNLIFVLIFCGITIIYDKTFGLTETRIIGNSVYFSNSKFYEWTLSINHAIIISSILLLVHAVFTKRWKSSLIVVSAILVLLLYFSVII